MAAWPCAAASGASVGHVPMRAGRAGSVLLGRRWTFGLMAFDYFFFYFLVYSNPGNFSKVVQIWFELRKI
jgi:hypothetical protein